MPSSFDIIRCCRLGFDMAGCNRRVRLRNPLREICTVGSVREETSRWCHGEPKRARSWKRRTQPRKNYSLSGLLYAERGDLSTVGTSEIRGTTMKPDGGDCGRQRLRSRRASAFPERTSVVANALRGARFHAPAPSPLSIWRVVYLIT
jgi:hypothetical protein